MHVILHTSALNLPEQAAPTSGEAAIDQLGKIVSFISDQISRSILQPKTWVGFRQALGELYNSSEAISSCCIEDWISVQINKMRNIHDCAATQAVDALSGVVKGYQ